jgi:hypothetical protein
MTSQSTNSLRSAAIFKLSFKKKAIEKTPGFTFVYKGTLRELGVTETEVDEYIENNLEELKQYIEENSD